MKKAVSAKIQLTNLIEGLSLAVDLAENKPLQHAQNVTFLALQVAEKLGLTSEEKNSLYYAGLLHDITFTSKDQLCPVCDAIQEYDLSHLVPSLFRADTIIHCSRESWNGAGPKGLQGESIPLSSRLLSIIIKIDDVRGNNRDFWQWRQRIDDILKLESGNLFDPTLVRYIKELLQDRRFCLDLLETQPSKKVHHYQPQDIIPVSDELLSVLGQAFATFIDNKSKYTAHHSQDVAEVAEKIAKKIGLSEETTRSIRLASLLHDLGKVAIPDNILEKPGKLTEEEYSLIKNHPYYSAFILDKIPELEDITIWASYHHERLDGSGYFLGNKEKDLPLEARLIAIADVYAALAADRPYRKGMEKNQITKVMNEMAYFRHLDSNLVEVAVSF